MKREPLTVQTISYWTAQIDKMDRDRLNILKREISREILRRELNTLKMSELVKLRKLCSTKLLNDEETVEVGEIPE